MRVVASGAEVAEGASSSRAGSRRNVLDGVNFHTYLESFLDLIHFAYLNAVPFSCRELQCLRKLFQTDGNFEPKVWVAEFFSSLQTDTAIPLSDLHMVRHNCETFCHVCNLNLGVVHPLWRDRVWKHHLGTAMHTLALQHISWMTGEPCPSIDEVKQMAKSVDRLPPKETVPQFWCDRCAETEDQAAEIFGYKQKSQEDEEKSSEGPALPTSGTGSGVLTSRSTDLVQQPAPVLDEKLQIYHYGAYRGDLVQDKRKLFGEFPDVLSPGQYVDEIVAKSPTVQHKTKLCEHREVLAEAPPWSVAGVYVRSILVPKIRALSQPGANRDTLSTSLYVGCFEISVDEEQQLLDLQRSASEKHKHAKEGNGFGASTSSTSRDAAASTAEGEDELATLRDRLKDIRDNMIQIKDESAWLWREPSHAWINEFGYADSPRRLRERLLAPLWFEKQELWVDAAGGSGQGQDNWNWYEDDGNRLRSPFYCPLTQSLGNCDYDQWSISADFLQAKLSYLALYGNWRLSEAQRPVPSRRISGEENRHKQFFADNYILDFHFSTVYRPKSVKLFDCGWEMERPGVAAVASNAKGPPMRAPTTGSTTENADRKLTEHLASTNAPTAAAAGVSPDATPRRSKVGCEQSGASKSLLGATSIVAPAPAGTAGNAEDATATHQPRLGNAANTPSQAGTSATEEVPYPPHEESRLFTDGNIDANTPFIVLRVFTKAHDVRSVSVATLIEDAIIGPAYLRHDRDEPRSPRKRRRSSQQRGRGGSSSSSSRKNDWGKDWNGFNRRSTHNATRSARATSNTELGTREDFHNWKSFDNHKAKIAEAANAVTGGDATAGIWAEDDEDESEAENSLPSIFFRRCTPIPKAARHSMNASRHLKRSSAAPFSALPVHPASTKRPTSTCETRTNTDRS
ncbi:unnamed protein product [Amoebophrya sp. A25]|nr:unnamed protein product [Amoebophrya sp. A25]|eukprot:GSA25T00022428001.1